ncbi:MAG: inositol monophosphatase family protein, partial [Jatrophihabitans sp.]
MLNAAEQAYLTEQIARIAHQVVVPRFGHLSAGDIAQKAPGELVTVADRQAEQALAELLTEVLPGSVVVGEEAVAGDPAILAALAGPSPVWIVDPIDGTEAFVTGSPRFAMLVALASKGQLLASWTYAPLLGLTATATAGGGAWLNGQRLRVAAPAAGLPGLPVAMSQPRWWSEEHRAQFNALFLTGISPTFFDTSGLAYLELARGRHAAMLVSWELPWD